MYKTIRLILGDQLNAKHSWFKHKDKSVLYVMIEQRSETDYVNHHIQKIAAFFTAMRAFCKEKQLQGFNFLYYQLDNNANLQCFEANLIDIIIKNNIIHFEYQLPDEYRLDLELQNIAAVLAQEYSVTTQVYNTEHFLTQRDELAQFFMGKKSWTMENFYRYMRRKHQVLMEEDLQTPLTGQWNYDKDNRKALNDKVVIPLPLHFNKSVKDIVDMLQNANIKTIGNIDAECLSWATDREEALALLEFFITEQLAHFGTYEDAMSVQHKLIFHSQLSFCLNVKLISPLEVVKTVERYYHKNKDAINIAQVEGFIRQIIGWREYVRGIYWAYAADYNNYNYFNNNKPLPHYYWNAKTDMNCLKHCLADSLDNGYAHHIQRLMVIGNFALLIGASPDEVDKWYLGVYVDAIQWVQQPNTRGMSQYADGGIMATKPYTCGANYINKMSDYCKDCAYDKNLKYGQKACPMNSLYWNFHIQNENLLAKNSRLALTYAQLKNMNEEEKKLIMEQAQKYLQQVESL